MSRARLFFPAALAAALTAIPIAFAGAESPERMPGSSAPMVDLAPAALRIPSPPPASAPPERPRGSLVVRVLDAHGLGLRSRPGGPVVHELGDRTEFGSPEVLGVVRERGRWLGVSSSALPNGRLGWVPRDSGSISLSRTSWSIHADLSERTVELRRGRRVVQRLNVAVGRPGSPTPTGRFSITDKLAGPEYSAYYGCCILALSATQPSTPEGWQGGNRIAIHGTNSPGTIGTAASAGCLRAADEDLHGLMERAPLGTPVIIRR